MIQSYNSEMDNFGGCAKNPKMLYKFLMAIAFLKLRVITFH